MGLAYLAAYLDDVEIYDQNVNHCSDSHLTKYLDEHDFDIVGIGVVGGYYQYRRLLSICTAVRASKRDHLLVIGGYGPSPEPEYFLQKTMADICVCGEGENAFKAVVDGLRDKVVQAPIMEDVNKIKWPAWHKFDMNHYRLLRRPRAENSDFVAKVMSGRGCPFKCKFCYRMDKGFRPRSANSIAGEVVEIIAKYGINYIDFPDDLLMSSPQRVLDICAVMKPFKIKWSCSGRLNYATPDVMKIMAEAGCVFVNFGIESVDDEVLKKMKKGLTVKQINSGIEATLDAGISPGMNVIFGNDGDTKQSLNAGVDLLLKYDDGAQLRTIKPVTPYPGCPYYYELIEKGKMTGPEDFYEVKHVNADLVSVLPNGMSADEAHRHLKWANKQLLRNYYQKAGEAAVDTMSDLYDGKTQEFRGWRRA